MNLREALFFSNMRDVWYVHPATQCMIRIEQKEETYQIPFPFRGAPTGTHIIYSSLVEDTMKKQFGTVEDLEAFLNYWRMPIEEGWEIAPAIEDIHLETL